jgi:hypothetical protein
VIKTETQAFRLALAGDRPPVDYEREPTYPG